MSMRAWPVLASLLILSASGAQAAWMAAGGQEPSTTHDRVDLMFAGADAAPGPAQVYFQAFQSFDQLTLNPNVAALDGRVLVPGAAHHRAMLGHWKDCNRDGYVGLAESAIQDYASLLLSNTSVCPAGGAYNDGQWVSEMIGIGMVEPCELPESAGDARCAGVAPLHANERVLYAPGTMVWGDVGEPGSVPPTECPLAPLPPATTSGTGALLGHADCQTGRRLATTVNTLDADGALGLRFEDADHPERSQTSALNVLFPVTLFGGPRGPGALEAGSSAPAATLWDCSAPKAVDIKDPTGAGALVARDPSGDRLTGPQPALPVVGVVTLFADEDDDGATPGTRTVAFADDEGSLFWAPSPAPVLHDPSASWWDAAEGAADGPRGDCAPGTTSALRPANPGPRVEGGDAQVNAGHKDRASLVFTFYDGHRGLNERIDFVGGRNATADGGLLYLRHGRGGDGPLWSAESSSVNEPQLVTRGSLGPAGPLHWTYYAKLGPEALSAGLRIPGTTDGIVYGAEACGSFTTGVHEGWVCDAGRWWRDALDRDARPRYLQGDPYGPVPGERYHLRDVDCYDGHLGAGVYASAAQASPSLCV